MNKARVEFHTKIVNDAKGGSVSNVWTAINTISPRKFHARGAMQKTTGEWCYEPEEALEEIRQFAKEELLQVDVADFVKPDLAGPMEVEEDNEPTPMDVISGFRRTNPNKSGTGWSVPNKLWVILENEISYKFADVWNQMGKERVFPTCWHNRSVPGLTNRVKGEKPYGKNEASCYREPHAKHTQTGHNDALEIK